MPHPFPPPFKLIEHEESLELQDGSGQSLCWIYYEDEPTRAATMRRLSSARAMALAGVFLRGLIAEAQSR